MGRYAILPFRFLGVISQASFGFVGETLGGDTKRSPANDAADCSVLVLEVLVLEALVLEGETSRVHRGRGRFEVPALGSRFEAED